MSSRKRSGWPTVTYHVCVGGTGGRGRADRSADYDRAGAFGTILAPATLNWSTMNHLSLELDDSHRSVLMSVKFDKSEAAVGLHPDLGEIATRLEERDEIGLGSVWSEVSDVDSAVVCGGLLDYRLVGKGATGEVDGGRNADASGGAVGGDSHGRSALGLLVRPIDSNSTRAQPFAIHGSDCLLGISLVTEGEEAVTTRFSGVHIPHDTGIGEGTEGAECLTKNFIVNLRTEITNEDMVVRGGVLLVLTALVCPVDADLGIKDFASVKGLEGSLGSTHVHVLNETVVETTVLVVTVGDDLYMLNRTSDGEDLCEHVFGDPRGQVSDVEMGASLVVDGCQRCEKG